MRDGNNHMVQYKDYVSGWLASSVHAFLGHLPRASRNLDFALITCLDSHLEPRSLLRKSPELKSVARDAVPVKTGILLPTARMLEATADNQIFFGFDEVWFFPHDKIKPKPDAAWLVGPKRIDQKKLDKLGPWMAENGCSLALGDGDGLNLIVKARGVVKYLISYSLCQPRPTNGGEVG
jgi:hypothetical protein